MDDFIQNLQYDFSELLEQISDFFKMLRNDVWDDDLMGLITYLYSCFPPELRAFVTVIITFVVILGIRELLRSN